MTKFVFSTYLKTASNLTTPLQTAVHCKINCGIDSKRASNKLVKIANDNIINFEQLIESPLRQRPRPRTTISCWTIQLNKKNINCLKVENSKLLSYHSTKITELGLLNKKIRNILNPF